MHITQRQPCLAIAKYTETHIPETYRNLNLKLKLHAICNLGHLMESAYYE